MTSRPAPVAACAALVFVLAIVALAAQRTPRAEAPPALAPRSTTPPRPVRNTGPVDVNHADQATLETLPGIGPTTARRIVEARAASGGFRTLADLDAVKGIGPRALERLAPRVVFGPSAAGAADPDVRSDR